LFKAQPDFANTMWRQISPRSIFLSALVLLLSSAIAAGWMIYRLYDSARWVQHTFEVQLALDTVEKDVAKAGRSRSFFVSSSDSKFLQDFKTAREGVVSNLARVKGLLHDNQEQLKRCESFEAVTRERLADSEESIELAKSGIKDDDRQSELTLDIIESATHGARISDEINNAEQILLNQRRALAARLFRFTVIVLAAAFLLAVFLIWEYYRRLAQELRERTNEEHKSRRLSIQLLQAQDEERRRIARELHDGLGQSLSAAKILADTHLTNHPNDEVIIDLASILTESLNGARTMSYLLHPPLLDEVGLASAAEWFVEGFSKRTGINVNFAVEGEKRRLGQATELTLFRVLQESLTNIHRHAKASAAEVILKYDGNQVALRVHDFGVGIPDGKLEEFNGNGAHLGLGLTGMKHRVQEQRGKFKIASTGSGTTVQVELPGV
jgi:signal transduction histidine kinase